MPDLRDLLNDEAARARGREDALHGVLRRAAHRRRIRRVTSGLVALAVAGGSFALAYAAFRPGNEARPGGAPLPGPSATPRPTPLVPLIVSNASGTEGAAEAAAAMLGADGYGPDGVEVSEAFAAGEGEGAATTTIFCHPSVEAVARSLRDRYFPDAELQGRVDPSRIVIAVGDDFVRDNQALLANFDVVDRFMTARVQGSGAESFLSDDARRAYSERVGGLDLYGYTARARFQVTALRPREDASAVAVVRIDAGTLGYETLTVGDHDPVDGTPEILAAELNEVPAPVGPASDEVRSFVEEFLEARRIRSGAGTFLGEEARAAYASHEGGLDLLGYAAGPDPVDATITHYDRLSAENHQVVVRFERAGADIPAVVETLLIGWRWLGGDVFVVLDAERTE